MIGKDNKKSKGKRLKTKDFFEIMKNEKLRMKNYSITPKPKLQFLIPLIPNS